MFHDLGLTRQYRSATERFEVDSANAARDFLRHHGIDEAAIDIVWDAIALHTTPGIPQHKKPEVALVTAGVEMDVLGIIISSSEQPICSGPFVFITQGRRRNLGQSPGATRRRLSRFLITKSPDLCLKRWRRADREFRAAIL